MAKKSLTDYWGYYKWRYDHYLRYKDKRTKHNMDKAYKDYIKNGGKRKKLK